jgi:hypothetical protein
VTKRGTPSEHPTLVPLYDVEKAAREVVSIPPPETARPDTARGAYRDQMPTYTDPVELEAARVKSTFTLPPPSAVAAAPESGPASEEAQRAAYEKRLGSFSRVPTVVLPPEAVNRLSMDGRASMLLALLDGHSSIEDLLSIGILNPLDTLSGLVELIERGVILLR